MEQRKENSRIKLKELSQDQTFTSQKHGTSLDLKRSMDKFKDSIHRHSFVPIQVNFTLGQKLKFLKNKDYLTRRSTCLYLHQFSVRIKQVHQEYSRIYHQSELRSMKKDIKKSLRLRAQNNSRIRFPSTEWSRWWSSCARKWI